MSILQQLLLAILQVASFLIIAEIIMSWLVGFNILDARNPTVNQIWGALRRVTDPILNPIRRILPPMGGLDFSPIVAFLIIMVLQGLITGRPLI